MVVRTLELIMQWSGEVTKGDNMISEKNGQYLVDISKEQHIAVKQLWLDKISEFIYVERLREKYGYQPQKFVINPIYSPAGK